MCNRNVRWHVWSPQREPTVPVTVICPGHHESQLRVFIVVVACTRRQRAYERLRGLQGPLTGDLRGKDDWRVARGADGECRAILAPWRCRLLPSWEPCTGAAVTVPYPHLAARAVKENTPSWFVRDGANPCRARVPAEGRIFEEPRSGYPVPPPPPGCASVDESVPCADVWVVRRAASPSEQPGVRRGGRARRPWQRWDGSRRAHAPPSSAVPDSGYAGGSGDGRPTATTGGVDGCKLPAVMCATNWAEPVSTAASCAWIRGCGAGGDHVPRRRARGRGRRAA